MRICVAQTRPIKGDIQKNIDNHLKLTDLAISDGTDIIVFPELSLTGYEPSLAKAVATHPDDNRFDVFQTISNAQQITIGVGVPTKTPTGICISLLLFQPHQTRQAYSKRYLHVDEEPFFVSGESFPSFKLHEVRVAPAICYELSVPEHAENAHQSGADIYVASVAKSAKGVDQAYNRLAEIAGSYSMTVLMSNCVGPSEDFESAGNTAVWNDHGELKGQLDDAHEGILIYNTDTQEVIEKQCYSDQEIQVEV